MKKIIGFTFLFATVIAAAQNDIAEDTTAKSAITAIGKPDGAKTEMKIGKEGGSFTSSDGKVKLTIPEGAVSKKTTFSIQPVTNLMPNGNGKAYHLEPSGTQFKKPIELVFHYDPEESEDSAQFLMAIAMQDDKGQWYGLNKFTLDTVAKTISGNINHFSTWATFDKLALLGPKRLKVTKTDIMVIYGVDDGSDRIWREELEKHSRETYGQDVLSPLRSWKRPQKGIWKVNGIVKGNPEFGTLMFGKVDESRLKTNDYTAPRNVPDVNPVTVSVDLVGASFLINGKYVTGLNLKTKVLIYDDAYEVTMISEIQDPSGTCLGATTYADAGSFVVSLNGKEPRIIERVNKNTSAFLNYSGGRCWDYKILKPGTGSIHIAGTPVIKVTPASAPGKSAMIEIIFRKVPSIFPLFQVTCKCDDAPGGPVTSTNAQGIAMMAAILPAQPINIKFEAKEGEQTILEHGKPGGQLYAKFTVKQLKED